MEDVSEQQPARSLRSLKIAAVIGVVVMLVAAQRFGIFEQFRDPAGVKQTILDLGPWGYVAFFVAYATLQPFGIPGTVFVFAASLIWPWPIAFGLSMVSTMAASVVGFSFARFVAREWLAKIVPQRFKKYDDALERRAFTTVVILRFIFWMPPLLHAFFGVSKVRFWTHFWGSFVGYLVPLLLMSFFGERLLDLLKSAPLVVWIAVPIALAAIGFAWWMCKRMRRARRAITTMSIATQK